MGCCHFAVAWCETPFGMTQRCLYLWLSKENAETQKLWIFWSDCRHRSVSYILHSILKGFLSYFFISYTSIPYIYLILFVYHVLVLFTLVQEAELLSLLPN